MASKHYRDRTWLTVLSVECMTFRVMQRSGQRVIFKPQAFDWMELELWSPRVIFRSSCSTYCWSRKASFFLCGHIICNTFGVVPFRCYCHVYKHTLFWAFTFFISVNVHSPQDDDIYLLLDILGLVLTEIILFVQFLQIA